MGTTAGETTDGPTSGPTTETTVDPSASASASASDGTTSVGTDGTTGDGTDGTTSDGTDGTDTGVVEGPCEGGAYWTHDADFDEGVLNNVNHDDPNNDQLQVTKDGVSLPKPYMFLAQTNEGVVLKVDTITGAQLGRYISTLTGDCPTCAVGTNQAYPSRIMVDFDGDMLVANRAFNGQGALTKIAGSKGACVDKNNNGKIDTSTDANDDGVIDIADPAEYFGQDDECILWTIPIGAVNSLPRALTLDGKGTAWVGTYSTKKAYQVDLLSDPPEIIKEINLPSSPYGFALWGDYLYSSALGQPVMRVDLKDDSIVTMTAPGNYGIAVDQNGIGWFGGSGLLRCDFDQGGACQQFNIGGSMNGVAVDGFGQVWGSRNGVIYKFANDGSVLGTANAPSSYGIAIGHDSDPRVIGFYDAYRISAGKPGEPPGEVTTYSTAHKSGSKPFNYTYTDFTGFGSQNITVKKGEWTATHDSGVEGAEWVKLLANQEPEGDVPPGTLLTYQIRAADTEAALGEQPWVVIESENIGEFVGGRYLEVLVRLIIEDEQAPSPVLSDLCVDRI
jgi:hypothetical protein